MALDGNFCRSLRDGLLTSFVDASVASEQNLRAQLLANDMSGSGTKVISVLEQELLRCQKFDFSVAFITMAASRHCCRRSKNWKREVSRGAS